MGRSIKLKNLVRRIPILKEPFLQRDQLEMLLDQLIAEQARSQNIIRQLEKQLDLLRDQKAQLQTMIEHLQDKQAQLQTEQAQLDNEICQLKKERDHEKEIHRNWINYLITRKPGKKQHKIATIINYCTTDYKFLKFCVREAKKFSDQIILPISDYFFDGTPENRELLKRNSNEIIGVVFKKFDFDHNKEINHPQFWITYSRWVGFLEIDKSIDYILFLDIDEILEGDKFVEWLDNFNYQDYDALMLASYWYFREPKFRAQKTENQGLIVRKSLLNQDIIMNWEDRNGIFEKIEGKKILGVLGLDWNPMVHHYSWVRTKDEMLKKVQTWGHKNDRDWIQLIEKEFQREFTEDSIDFVHNYTYKIVKPYIELND